MNVVGTRSQVTQRGLVMACASDQQLCFTIPVKNGNESLQAFKLLQTPHEQEIRFLFCLFDWPLGCLIILGRDRHKMGQMYNRDIESHFRVDLFAKQTRRNKCIHMLELGFQETEMPPPLWRALIYHATCEAMRPCAGRAIKFK